MFSNLTIFTDGGSRGNPGEAAIGVFVVDEQGNEVWSQGKKIGLATNNEAEYQAVIASLDWLKQQAQLAQVSWMLDSLLVVKQLKKEWKIKEPRLRDLADQCWTKLLELKIDPKLVFHHIYREKNTQADALLNQALDQK